MNEVWMAWTQNGMAILLQLVVIIGLFLLRKLKGRMEAFYDAHTTTQQRALLGQIGREAFAFAETVYREYDGPAKMNEAIKYLLDAGSKLGLQEISLTDARAVIESAWLNDKRSTSS